MLTLIKEVDFTETEKIKAIIHNRWCAICLTTGAFLRRTRGNPKSEQGFKQGFKYILIAPNQTIEERGGVFEPYDFEPWGRKVIRAWSDSEAISIANKRLEKIFK